MLAERKGVEESLGRESMSKALRQVGASPLGLELGSEGGQTRDEKKELHLRKHTIMP